MTFIQPLPPPYLLRLFLFLSWLLQFHVLNAQTYTNVTLGSSLIAQDNNISFWGSPSGEFAFGFRQIQKVGFLLAIWFDKIPEKTIVWSANGDNLVPSGSKVELTANGNLNLIVPETREQIWKADYSDNITAVIAYAAMLDIGNFVLASSDSVHLWETFKQPTDTILPMQTLSRGSTLFARYMDTNYSKGRFMFSLQSDGNLVLYAKHSPSDFDNNSYWASDTNRNNSIELVSNMSGSIYLASNNGSIIYTISPNVVSSKDFYQRAILEHDGVFRRYVYPKSSTTSNISTQRAWFSLSTTPSNMCLILVDEKGVGPCGFNSYCMNDQGRPTCHCPQGYSFIDPNDSSKGCKQDFVSQNCDDHEASPQADVFRFYEMPNGDWLRSDYNHFEAVTEEFCRQNCLADCFCAAATFRDGFCYKKKSPLSNGRIDSSIAGKTIVKIRKLGNSSTTSQGQGSGLSKPEKKGRNSTLIVVGSVLLSSSVFLNIFLLLVTLLVTRSNNLKKTKEIQQGLIFPGMDLICFTYEEIKKITNEFEEEIGSGASGTVFKGLVPSDGHNGNYCVAVKRFKNIVAQSETEFKAEVDAIGRTNHRNLVKLMGFCNSEQHQLLVYEFMSNDSLASVLFGDSSRLNWKSRIQIALETARGLLYLHQGCSTQIIHCDIKPQNILLDEYFSAKVSDFGLAKLLKTDQSRTTTLIRGTKGYVAPEWFRNMPITVKVDVYSYGILLLEIICNRKNFEATTLVETQMVLSDWAYDCYAARNLDQLVKDDNEAMDDLESVEKYVKIAMWCIQESPEQRPTMKNVIQMIEGTIEVPIPPDPSSS
ncbi:hypothetical protein FNV43_RR15070 [Rhamnella rubrinervis]|uniref:Receptor-like serine/threonine-protein kinase n=1 Tax=Rhamnella rubrinervis TaxID=2594499 RepID=A0A8K0GWH2_9ROSA|nr:hypothetical protein FNV43_RR15070 [Rhamnella rubrinervis]